MRFAFSFAAFALGGLFVTACSSPQRPAATPSPAIVNPLGFPLYPGSSILSTQPLQHGSYRGRDVVAESRAGFAQLAGWVEGLDAHPPRGYAAASGGSASERMQASAYGLDYATLKSQDGKHLIVVVVMDPQRVNSRFGTVLGMIERYGSLPAMMRAPIDAQVKQRYGITLSQAMQPDNPIGAALSALSEFSQRNTRGIVVLDAARR